MIRKDCYWYRPWKDMSATIDQCYFHKIGECHCCSNCEMHITKKMVDKMIEFYVDYVVPFYENEFNEKTSE